MKSIAKNNLWDRLHATLARTLSGARIWRPFLYLRDLNKDGKNWFDYRKRIKVLESLAGEPPFGPEELEGAVSYLLALEYESIATYYSDSKAIGQIDKARSAMERARTLRGDDFLTRMKLAHYHDLVGDVENALATLKNSARTVPELHYLAELYARTGKYDRAIDTLSAALEIRQLYLLYFGLGEAYEIQGDIASAAENYRLAMEDFPQRDEYVDTFAGHPTWVEGAREWKMMSREEVGEKYDALRATYQQACDRTR
jgi:tetratricopeptide (TPR) repeat protein